jgi:hypothetical protein
MTDITDQDLRKALAWAEGSMARGGADAAARYILATVDAPEPTPAEELRDTARWWREGAPTWEQCCDRFESLAARAEQIEQERDHFFSEVENVRNWKEGLLNERDEARAEVERLTAERQEETMHRMNERYTDLPVHDRDWTRTDGTPDPADVPEGQAWAVSIDDMEETAGFKASVFGWICYRELGGTTKAIPSDRITLVSRLVPAPRQITTREILDEAPRRTVIRDKDGVVCERASLGDGWYSPESTTDQTDYIKYPATVLWTPEVPA